MRVLLGSIEGGRRRRICMLLIELPDFLHPLAAARTCALASARSLAAVLAHQQMQHEAAGLGAAGAADRRHYVAFGRKQTTRRCGPPASTERRDESGTRRVRRETEDARPQEAELAYVRH